MLSFFLLADALKRLTLNRSQIGPEDQVNVILLESTRLLVRELNSILNKDYENSTVFDTPISYPFLSTGYIGTQLGIRQVYASWEGYEINDNRNRAKKFAISHCTENQPIRIIARTAHAYLATRGQFRSKIREALEAGKTVEVIVSAATSLEYYTNNGYTSSGILIDEKWRQAMDGAKALIKEFNSDGALHIRVRTVSLGIPATALITDQTSFFEPYIPSSTTFHPDGILHLFELELDPSDTGLAKRLEGYWTFLKDFSKVLL